MSIGECNKGIGAFFYPTVLWVTESTLPPVTNETRGNLRPPGKKTRKIALSHQLVDTTKIIVTDDGFIGLFSMNDKEALNFLNTILAASITYGIGSEYLTNNYIG